MSAATGVYAIARIRLDVGQRIPTSDDEVPPRSNELPGSLSGEGGGAAVAAGAAAGQMTRSMEGHAGAVAAVCWPSADTIYSGSWDRSVRQWDAETGALTQVRRSLSACPFFWLASQRSHPRSMDCLDSQRGPTRLPRRRVNRVADGGLCFIYSYSFRAMACV